MPSSSRPPEQVELVLRSFRLLDGKLLRVPSGRPVKPQQSGPYSSIHVGTIRGRKIKWRRHQVVFLLAHGFLPPYVDHADSDQNNDDPANLRAASMSQNLTNVPSRHGRELPRGVTRTRSGRFKAQLKQPHVSSHHLGVFDTPEEASAKVEEVARRIHGEFYVKPPE